MTLQFIFYVVLYFYIFVQKSSTSYILCTSKCSQLAVSFLQPLNIPPECQDNNVTDINEFGLVCVIDYRIDYDAKYIYINFKASNDPIIFQDFNQSEFLIQTTWLGFNEDSGQPNITHRKYGCSTKNDCARQFYYDTIEDLIKNGQLLLNTIKSKLYRKSLSAKRNSSRRCKNSNTTSDRSSVRCRDGLCYVNNMNERTFCTYDNIPTFFSEFEYYLPRSTTNEIELIEYKCNRHFCNSNKMLNTIKDILRRYTNWNNNVKENSVDEEYSDQTKEDYPVIEEYSINKVNETIANFTTKTSSAIHKDVSYILILLTLLNLRLFF